MSESKMALTPMWSNHRGVTLWSQRPKFLGKAHITLLLPGATGTMMNTIMR